jgi:hypothetical protein
MARQPRIDLAGIPQHEIQRGNNRETCFFEDDDRHHYLEWLRKAAAQYGGLAQFLAYQDLFRNAMDNNDLETIRRHVNQGKVLGSETVRNRVEAVASRRVRLAGPGRPRNVL